jgi:hypothetical protein
MDEVQAECDDPVKDESAYQDYLRVREALVTYEQEVFRGLDNWLLTISGAALIFLATVSHDRDVLGSGWTRSGVGIGVACFAIALIAGLVAKGLATIGVDKQLQGVDRAFQDAGSRFRSSFAGVELIQKQWNGWTYRLTALSLLCCVLGVASVAVAGGGGFFQWSSSNANDEPAESTSAEP